MTFPEFFPAKEQEYAKEVPGKYSIVSYSITNVEHGADSGFLAVSPQVTGAKLYCLVTEAHRCM